MIRCLRPVGGLGLTGLILEVELKLIKASSWFETENIKFNNLDEFSRFLMNLKETLNIQWRGLIHVRWVRSLAGASL